MKVPITITILVLQHYHHQYTIVSKPKDAQVFKKSFLPPQTVFSFLSHMLLKVKNEAQSVNDLSIAKVR